jgi:four helix bundle protein
MGAKHFSELVCWQRSNDLAQAVYAATANDVVRSDEDFCRDIRRSSRSAAANIAEGFGRETHREFARYLSIARASLVETENHLVHGRQCDYFTEEQLTHMRTLCKRAVVATTRLQAYLKGSRDR